MAEFFEVPARKEDGSESLHCVNIDAVSYIDLQVAADGRVKAGLVVHLNNGYWFTLTGEKAEEVLNLIRTRNCIHFKEHTDNN